MGLSAFEILDVLELIVFVPFLFVSGYVTYKHGHHKQLGWRFLVMICLFRVVGAITSLINAQHPSSGLTITSDVMNTFGLSAIIYTALGLLQRVELGMGPHGLPLRLFRLLHLPGLAGLILSIIGSTNVFSNNPSDESTGFTELKVAMCLFLAVFVVDVLVAGHSFFNISQIQQVDRRLLFAVAAALPFTAVRVLFSLLCVFLVDHTWFSSWSEEWKAILVHGTMGVLMEAIIVAIYIFAGLTTAPAEPQGHRGAPPQYQGSKAAFAQGVSQV